MAVSHTELQSLIRNPSESLSTEVKTWLNLTTDDGKANLIRAILALRNHNGGRIIIGFDASTMLPDEAKRPDTFRIDYSIDKVQQLVGKYASPLFEVLVDFVERDRSLFPVITIPSGIKTPVMVRVDLTSQKKPIKQNEVYVRALQNHTPSSIIARPEDWDALLQRCFDNREADIGTFLRRHLGSIDESVLRGFANTIAASKDVFQTDQDLLRSLLTESENRFTKVLKPKKDGLADFGTWEVVLIVQGKAPVHAMNEVLNLIKLHNPNYTGWPIWMDPRHIDKLTPPFVFEGFWESLIIDMSYGNSVDFMRFSPEGKFSLIRGYFEDLPVAKDAPPPFKTLDMVGVIRDVAETIAVGLALARGWHFGSPGATLGFLFRWNRINGRALVTRRNRRQYPFMSPAVQDMVESTVLVPIDAPESMIATHVRKVVDDLFVVFNGTSADIGMVESETKSVLQRKNHFNP